MALTHEKISEEYTSVRWFQKGKIEFTENGSVIIPIGDFRRGSIHASDETWGTLKFEISDDLSGVHWETLVTFDGSEANHTVEFVDVAYLRIKITSTGYRGTVFHYFNGRV